MYHLILALHGFVGMEIKYGTCMIRKYSRLAEAMDFSEYFLFNRRILQTILLDAQLNTVYYPSMFHPVR